MRNLVLIAIFILAGLSIHAQAIIRVQGEASRMVEPDKATLSITLNSEDKIGDLAYQLVEEKIRSIHRVLTQSELPDSLFKVDRVHVQFIKSYNQARQDVFQGSTSGSIELEADALLVTGLMNAIQSEIDANVSISFGLFDNTRKKYEDGLLKEAITQARSKADIMAGSLDLEIQTIKSASYNFSQVIEPYAGRAEMSMDMKAARSAVDFNINEIQISQSVQIEFLTN